MEYPTSSLDQQKFSQVLRDRLGVHHPPWTVANIVYGRPDKWVKISTMFVGCRAICFLFLFRASNTQLNHWTTWVVRTQLITWDPTDSGCHGPRQLPTQFIDSFVRSHTFLFLCWVHTLLSFFRGWQILVPNLISRTVTLSLCLSKLLLVLQIIFSRREVRVRGTSWGRS